MHLKYIVVYLFLTTEKKIFWNVNMNYEAGKRIYLPLVN